MERKRLSKSIRKYIRQEKSRIYQEFLDIAKQRELINQLYQKFYSKIKKEENKK